MFQKSLVDDVTRRTLSAIILLCMWLKMFDWLRMFNSLSMYVSLVIETIIDITPFLAIFVLFLFMFGSAMFILNAKSDDTVNAIIDEYVADHEYINMMIN